MRYWNTKQLEGRPKLDQMAELKRGDKRINPLLWDLLTQGCPYKTEEIIRGVLKNFFKTKCKLDVSNESKIIHTDTFGNLYVDLRTDLAVHKSMFSAHMDIVAHDGYKRRELFITDECTKGHEPGHIYACTADVSEYELYDIDKPEFLVDFKSIFKVNNIKYYTLMVDDSVKVGNKVKITIAKKDTEYAKAVPTSLMFWGKPSKVRYNPSTLGADDKIGCYIMSRMIQANIPALYVFHVGEEAGCQGSRWIVNNNKDIFTNTLSRCVAFDRAGYADVIQMQRGTDRSSREFSIALAKAINGAAEFPPNVQYKSGVVGVYTDSAEYSELIPECCNLSVGYFDQHGVGEHTDVLWLEQWGLPAFLKVDWDALPTVRDNKKKPFNNYDNYAGNYVYRAPTLYQGKILAVKDVRINTAYGDLPKWEFKDGLLPDATPDGMKRLIERFVFSKLATTTEKTDFVWNTLQSMADMQDHIIQLRRKLASLGDVDELVTLDGKGNIVDDENSNDGPFSETIDTNLVLDSSNNYVETDDRDPNGDFDGEVEYLHNRTIGKKFSDMTKAEQHAYLKAQGHIPGETVNNMPNGDSDPNELFRHVMGSLDAEINELAANIIDGVTDLELDNLNNSDDLGNPEVTTEHGMPVSNSHRELVDTINKKKCIVCSKSEKQCRCTEAEKLACVDDILSGKIRTAPLRVNYKSEAEFQTALGSFLEQRGMKPAKPVVRVKAGSKLIVPTQTEVEKVLADPDIRNRLEK